MTTSVKIKHEGPHHHNVCVRVIDGEAVSFTCEITPGETSSAIYVYNGRKIEISEKPEVNPDPVQA